MSIFNFTAYDPTLIEERPHETEYWCSGQAECLTCGYEWMAVWPLATAPLECPDCGSHDTDRTPETKPVQG